MDVKDINIDEIFCDHDFNCRGAFKGLDVLDLAKSISDIGLQQPIVIQPWAMSGRSYRILSGHRRYTACKNLGHKTIPCVIKVGLDEYQARVLNIEENLKRKNLNILQEAKAIKFFDDAGWNQKEIAERLDESTNWVAVRLSLLKLPEDIQMEAAAGFLTQEHIKALSKLGTKQKDKMYEAVHKIKHAKLVGDRKKIEIVKKPPNPFSKKMRTREEIFKVMAIIQDTVGNSFHTRILAWVAGEINEFEFQRELKTYIEKSGFKYEIPKELIEAIA